jgi:large subunit ribosomal protein L9
VKVILLKDVGGVGRRDEVREVSDGYAFNFLIARGLAVQATSEALARHEKNVSASAAKRAADEERLAKSIRALEGKRIELTVRATEKGGLFKSIGADEIQKALGDIPQDAIVLQKPIKSTGEHQVTIRASGAEAHISIAVSAIK